MRISFTGNFEGTVVKERIVLPSEFRSQVPLYQPDDTSGSVTLTLARSEIPHLLVYPTTTFDVLLQQLSEGDENQEKLFNWMVFHASPTQQFEEKSGRIRIPQKLLMAAGITDRVFLYGAKDCITVWSPENYEKQEQAILNDMSGISLGLKDYQVKWKNTTSRF